jgi:hypothetical protein
MRLRPILRGLKTYVALQPDRKGTGGTISARYCYGVWLRHLVLAHGAGAAIRPRVVAELGPGDSLGIGLAASLTGAERYVGLDVVRHASDAANAAVFEGLVELFRKRAAVPTPEEFPEVRPPLESYAFPAAVLPDDLLARTLAPDRVAWVRAALDGIGESPAAGASAAMLTYRVPWDDPGVIEEGSVDFLYSQAVLEHVEHLDVAYDAMRRWLAPGGTMTHQVDFKAHGMTPEWNGHLAYPDWAWSLVKGRRTFLLNRAPWSDHVARLARHGFRVLRVLRSERTDGLPSSRLAPRFRGLCPEDAVTSGAFVVAVKS